MRLFCLMLIAFVQFSITAAPASAGTDKCADADPTACVVANFQASRKPYSGALSGKLALACVRLLASTRYAAMTEVVLVGGGSATNGPVLTSLGRGRGHAFRLEGPAGTDDIYVREFCFNPKLIRGYSAITFCNGFNPGDGNHHVVSGNDLAQLRRTGHVGDFLSLLGTKRTYGSPRSVTTPVERFYTTERYGRIYGTRGIFRGM